MPTERAHTIEQILAVYIEAKLDSAARQFVKAKAWYDCEQNEYTTGQLLWARHQWAAVKLVARDVHAWKTVIKKYHKALKKRKDQKCNVSQPPSQPPSFAL